jgi:hypothetical protein
MTLLLEIGSSCEKIEAIFERHDVRYRCDIGRSRPSGAIAHGVTWGSGQVLDRHAASLMPLVLAVDPQFSKSGNRS